MKIGVVGSMQFTEKMIEIAKDLKKLGHDPILSNFVNSFLGKDDSEKEVLKLKQKFDENAIKRDLEIMKKADAVLVLNFDKHDIKNYIGGNTLMEIGFAHVLNQKIFLWNPIPEIPYYKSEIEAVRPVIINGDLSLIK